MKKILSSLLPTLILTLLPALASSARAAQEVIVEDGGAAQVVLSQRELTRVAMADGSKLTRVWGVEGQFTVQADDEAGEAYLRPIEGAPVGRALSFFVRDAAGATYALTGAIADLPAQTVMIKPKNRARRAADQAAERSEPYVGAIKTLMRSMLESEAAGEVAGCTEERIGQMIPLWREAAVEIVRRWHCERFQGEVLSLKNVSSGEMRLDEREFQSLYPDIRAVAIPLQVLASKEETSILLLRALSP